ncbi:MAG: TIR domain-containing protein [Rubrivivax sp.]|nr:TIR domain-containing protein [Rubrivivax sp.]
MAGSLFISYSHADTAWMQLFKRHLQGMLRERCHIWTDEEIAPGTTWLQSLEGSLHGASAGLVLASPDYLISDWCRAELAALAEALRRRKLQALYWVLLRPCGWQWTELKDLQAVQEPATRALIEASEGVARDDLLLHCCDRIASGVMQAAQADSPEVATVKHVLRETASDVEIAPGAQVIRGDFSILCRGLHPNGDDVFIKVLTNTPLHTMRRLFQQVSEVCGGIQHPSVIRITKVAQAGDADQARIVILSEMARGASLLKVMHEDLPKPPHKRHLQIDSVRVILRRLAEALGRLHEKEPIPWPDRDTMAYTHIMGPLLPDNIFYERESQRPQLSLVGVTNFLWHFFETQTFLSIVRPRHGVYLLPEKSRPGNVVDARADQYFLGMLALELLECRQLFIPPPGRDPVDPLVFLREGASRHWADRHEQLRALLERLLAKDPAARFPSMQAVIAELRDLETGQRALAKYAYNRYVAPGQAAGRQFAQRFYAILFERAPRLQAVFLAAQAERQRLPGATQAVPDEAQYRKLADALKLVLNFQRGGRPTVMDSVAANHARFLLSAADFDDFAQALLQALRETLQASPAGRDEEAEAMQAWGGLLEPVMTDMQAVCGTAGSTAPGVTSGSLPDASA